MPRRPVLLAAAAIAAAGIAAPLSASLAAGTSAPRPETAVLLGKNEVPKKGDPKARGIATVLVPSPGRVCFAIVITGTDTPVGAHIHKGGPGVSGPIVVPLTPPNAGNPGTSAGCTTGARVVVADIAAHASRYYVNVHTKRFPAGGMRGQLVAH